MFAFRGDLKNLRKMEKGTRWSGKIHRLIFGGYKERQDLGGLNDLWHQLFLNPSEELRLRRIFFSRADSNIYDIVENVQDWEVKKPLQLFFPTFIPLRLNEKTIILHAVFFLKPNKTSGEINHVETKITHAQSKKNKKKKNINQTCISE